MTDDRRDQEPDAAAASLLRLEALYAESIPKENLCPECSAEPAVDGGRCIICRGRSMQ